jgi:hypothetical protein
LLVRLLVLGTLFSARARAQRGLSDEGALFLLLPMGARVVSTGQSVAMPQAGSEQLYWNPSAVARATKREFALHYGDFFVGPMVAGAAVLPMGRAGVVGASISILDYGSQETGDASGPTGSTSQQSYILGATYAATIGTRATLGVTFKNAHFVGTCSGLCPPIATFHVSTSAVDIGAQYRVVRDDDVVIGFAVRSLGLRFQVNDEPQSDPLPTRIQAGASVRLRVLERELPDAIVRVNADAIDRLLDPGSLAFRLGAEVEWREQLAARMGYVDGVGEGTGFGVGFGFMTGRMAIDLGHTLGGGSVGLARGSTFFSLRGRW